MNKTRRIRALAAAAASFALVACGGGGGGSGGSGSASCDLASQRTWLRDYMQDMYYWSGQSPNPAPLAGDSLSGYFGKLLFPGDGSVPADRWSYIESSASYSQFFEEGRTLGYGLAVNGLEGRLPLKLRYVEPGSPAAAAGLRRGDTVVSVNGVSAASLVAGGDYSVLSPANEGETITVELNTASGRRTASLVAAVFTLTPVSTTRVLTLAGGKKAGYVMLKDFIPQAETPLANAFASFRAAGATELIIDLRYNGGGRISTSNALASLVSGFAHSGKVFATLTYNPQQQALNKDFTLTAKPGPVFQRVVVITGARTCSASELVVNGLKPYATVVTIGDASCGKPFGFNPADSCGNTFSAVNFETVNGAGAGRYYDGLAATCPVDETFSGALGDPTETLTAAAVSYLATDACPAPRVPQAQAERPRRVYEPGLRQGMVAN